jgi:hypothetical protein
MPLSIDEFSPMQSYSGSGLNDQAHPSAENFHGLGEHQLPAIRAESSTMGQ